MIIKKLNFKVYGKLIDKEVNLHNGLNVIYGENEAGKSTVFNSILSLIYGFKPTNRDKHPYVNWDRNEINFSSEIEFSGELFGVERSLKSAPKFNWIQASSNSVKVYRNESLPMVSHVSDALFETVFHLSAENLNQVEKESWSMIQEKLIFNYGTDYLNKASDVILQLEQEINNLWRKDKRGNPQINILQNEIGELKLKRNEAEKYFERIRQLTDRRDELTVQLTEFEQKKRSFDMALKQQRTLLPVKELILRIETLEKSVYKPEVFAAIDPKITDQIASIRHRIQEQQSKLKDLIADKEKCVSTLFVFSEQDKRLLAFRREADRLKEVLADFLRNEQESHTKLDERVRLRDKIEVQYKLLFEGELNDALKETLKSIFVLDIMSLIQKYAEGYDKNAIFELNSLSMKKTTQKRNGMMAVLGIVLSLLGIFIEPIRVLVVLGVGLFTFALAKYDSKTKTKPTEIMDLEPLQNKINELLKGVPLPEYVWRDTSLRFFSKLEQLIMMIHDEEQLHRNWELHISKQLELTNEMDAALKACAFDTSRGAALSLQFVLAQIESLIEIETAEVKKQAKIESLDTQIIAVEGEICRFDETLLTQITQVQLFGEGDFEYGLEKVQANNELLKKIKIYKEELSLLTYDRLLLESVSVSEIERLETDLEALQVAEKSALNEQNVINNEILKYNDMSNLDDINSLILSHEEKLIELIELRNQKMILLEIIKFSDERFRLENQPNIITRVSYFMNRMTKGKYQEVLISETDGHFELQFRINGEIIPVTRAFSKGTLQQLFFAYRLAVIEALDPENILPFILDETFVNWDMHRFVETISLLEEISRHRQILFFTCHHNLALKISELVNVNIVEVA